MRSTIIVPNPWAANCYRFEAAKIGAIGQRVLSIEHIVARLAGGFLQPIDRVTLLDAVRAALLTNCPKEFEVAKDLPGLVRAITSSLTKAWSAGIDLAARAKENERLTTMAELERAVLALLPRSMKRPADLKVLAMKHLALAQAILGPIRIVGRTEMSPVWREIAIALVEIVPVVWEADARTVPTWITGKIEVETSTHPRAPVTYFSCADASHEVLEAVRWAKELIARGQARPEEIGICAAAPQSFDAQMAAISEDAALSVHFIHGRPAIADRDGQEAAALVEIITAGLSLQRFRRLASLAQGPAFKALPQNWRQVLPRDAPLTTRLRWTQMLTQVAEWPGGVSFADNLLEIIGVLDAGPTSVHQAAKICLGARALSLLERALLEGPAEALLTTLTTLALSDEVEGLTSIVWGPAAAIASYPRPFVRMIGLASGSWPRGISEDPLLPAHVVNPIELNPLPVSDADRRDFSTILACATKQVVASRSRRDSDGRLLGASPLWPVREEQELTKSRAPQRAGSRGDRLASRPTEFLTTPVGTATRATWRDWHVPEIGPHDGRIRADHPLILDALTRPMSASTIKLLLTNPIGWLFGEIVSLREPDPEDEPFQLDPLAFGNLVHSVIETAVKSLEAGEGLAAASEKAILDACTEAAAAVAQRFELEIPVPPARLWRLTVHRAKRMAEEALGPTILTPLPGQKSWAEIPFGRTDTDPSSLPWNPNSQVEIGGISITGKVDRLDLSGDGNSARVIDWKTGRVPRDGVPLMIGGGSEVQRPIYASAVFQLTSAKAVEAGLAYLRDGAAWHPVSDPKACLDLLSRRIAKMREMAAKGLLLPGPNAGSDYDEYSFALPGDAKVRYIRDKAPAVRAALGEAAQVWDDA